MSEPIPIPVANLLLDGRNPRLSERMQGQRKIIRALAGTQWDKLRELAKDIVEHGRDPSDLFLVMKRQRGRYLVLDGNRRVAVLKLFEEPSILDSVIRQSQMRILKGLSERYDHNLNREVLCIQVRDRGEASHWMELRHTGGHSGAGPERWSSEEGGRFSANLRGSPDSLETQALDFLEERGRISPADRSDFPTTTLRRLLGTPDVRYLFGVGREDGILYIASGREDDVADLLTHVVHDLSSRTGRATARGLNRVEDRVDYAESLPEDLLIRQQVGEDDTPATDSPRPARRRRRSQPARHRLIPSDADLHVSDERTRAIEQELRKLSLNQYPNAIGVLLRVFLELSASDYIERNSLLAIRERDQLDVRVRRITAHFADEGKLTRSQARAIDATTTRYGSIFRMNQLVHNQHLFPSAGELRSEWSTLQPWFEAVWSAEP